MSYVLEIFGRSLPDSLWPVFRESLRKPADSDARPKTTVRERTLQHVLAGVSALQSSAGGRAKEHFDRAISLRDGNEAALIGMACAVDLLGQPEQAKRYLEQAHNASPEDARILYALGLLEERCNRPDQAKELYQQSLYFRPNQKGSRHRLMALALAQQDCETAVRQAETLAAQFPLELPAWARLGALYLLNDDPVRACKSFEQALKLLADNWRSDSVLASENYEHDNWHEAVEEIRRTLERDENCADLHVRLGDLYAKNGKTDQAMAEYRQALGVNPYYLEATTKVAASYARAHQHEEAAMWLGRAIQINETMLMSYAGLALTQAYMGQEKESADTLAMARGIASNSPVLMAEIARLHIAEFGDEAQALADDQPKEARAAMRSEQLGKAIKIHLAWLTHNQDDASAWMRLGMLLEADKQTEYAYEAYEKAAGTYAGCTPALVRLGLRGSGQDSAAGLRQAFWPDKIDLGVHYELSVLFSQSQRFELTAEKFSEVLPAGQGDCFWRNISLGLEQMSMLNLPKNIWQSLTEISALDTAASVPVTSSTDESAQG